MKKLLRNFIFKFTLQTPPLIKNLETNLDIHIYGRGCEEYGNDERIKGRFEDKEPYENYLYHIVIENESQEHYISEKILNCYSYDTIPIYWGCKNIDN